jgi:hypothetical protein
MSESWRTRLQRVGFNLWPSYRGTGGRVRYIAEDWQEVRVEIPRNLRTRNYMGTTFGGSIYGACDPIYAMMLIQALPDEYTVWDKAASIRFQRPGTEDLYARFRLSDEWVLAARNARNLIGRHVRRAERVDRGNERTPRYDDDGDDNE